ncbi:hypothetical protein D3C84_1303040 [compost metagenome]
MDNSLRVSMAASAARCSVVQSVGAGVANSMYNAVRLVEWRNGAKASGLIPGQVRSRYSSAGN